MRHNIQILIFTLLSIVFTCFSGVAQDNFENLPTTSNWSSSETYDINGVLKNKSVSFFDELGRPIQAQSKDVSTNKIWATQTLYDYHGRPGLSTLSAPIGGSFGYRSNFMRKSNGSVYTITDFENTPENPSTVGAQTNTLGHYYSTSNTVEPTQDITSYPFTRTIYSTLNPGAPLKTIGGNKMNGKWLQGYSFSMPASQELSQSVAFGESKYNGIEVTKTVSRDIHGVENVVFTNTDGETLAVARSNGPITRDMNIAIGVQGFIDIHVPVGNNTGFTVNQNGNEITIHDLITEQTVTASNSLPNGFYRVSVNDQNNYDVNTPVTIAYHENYYDYSLNEYDDLGRLIASYQPVGNNKASKPRTTYQYDTEGQLIYTNRPDEGEAWFKYREDGQIRYSQNSKQKAAGEFSYTNYDGRSRPIESGVLVNTGFASTNPNGSLPAGTRKERHITTYDRITTADRNSLPTNYKNPSFLAGNVAKTWNDQTTTFYNYDIYGRVQWVVQNITGLGIKTIDYEYDPVTSQVHRVLYQKGQSDQFIHRYTYDTDDYSLTRVETSSNGNTYTTHANYNYYETGGLKQLNLANGLQKIDYVYNLSGALKSINHPNLITGSAQGSGNNKDLFGMNIHYYQGDYLRNPSLSSTNGIDQYNGNIKAITWNNKNNNSTATYYYKYNRNNWLQGASFNQPIGGVNPNINPTETRSQPITTSETVAASQSIDLTPGFSIIATPSLTFEATIDNSGTDIDSNGDYNVSGITYDANGNIKTLNRNKQTANGSNAMDELSYTYKDNKPNQLLQVGDAVGTVTDTDDIENQIATDNYKYNLIGQLIENKQENIAYLYNASGLVTEVKKDGQSLVKFFYNDKNHRVRKESYNPNNGNLTYTEYYVRDAAGTAMAIYRKDSNGTNLVENTVYGSSRLGVRKNDNTFVYQLTDHLGNVRGVIARNDGTALLAATDYYPFGMPMPGRDLKGDYRYAYQGQEKDTETGKEAFELRLWDARIGRWLTTDPYGEFHSPYLGMGNNPISNIDPDGGCVKCKSDAAIGSTDFDAGGNAVTMTETGWVRNDGYEANLGTFHTVKLEGHFGQTRFLMRPEDNMGDFWDRKNEATERLIATNWQTINSMGQVAMALLSGGYTTPSGQVSPRQYNYRGGLAPSARGWTIDPKKYDYFFGRVNSGREHSIIRSAQNKRDLEKLGITSEKQLEKVFDDAFVSGSTQSTMNNVHGTSVIKRINVNGNSAIDVNFFYPSAGGKPRVSTLIPKLSN